MVLIPKMIRRPTAILKMPAAIARGMTAGSFIKELRAVGGTYRRTLMLADWRSVSGIKAKVDAVKYVRKDRLPSMRAVADVEWDMSKEYMYKVKVWTKAHPDEPLEERFINLKSDKLMTPDEIESQISEIWGTGEKYQGGPIERTKLFGIYHRIESPSEE